MKKKLLIPLLCFVFLTACGKEVPIQEETSQITSATEEKATETESISVAAYLEDRIASKIAFTNDTMGENIAFYDTDGKCIFASTDYDGGITYFTDTDEHVILIPQKVSAENIFLTIEDRVLTRISVAGQGDFAVTFQNGTFTYTLPDAATVTSAMDEQEHFLQIDTPASSDTGADGIISYRLDEQNRVYEMIRGKDSPITFSLIYGEENIPVYSFYMVNGTVNRTEYYYPNGVLREQLIVDNDYALQRKFDENGELIEEEYLE